MAMPPASERGFNPAYDPKVLAAEASTFQNDFYARCVDLRNFYRDTFAGFHPKLAVVLGSGLGGLVKHSIFKAGDSLDYASIPHMAQPQTPNHEGKLYWGMVEGLPIMAFAGRVQTTDYLTWNTTPQRAARLATLHLTAIKGLNIDAVVLTSAAGLVKRNYADRKIKVGDVVVAADYTNYLPITNPLLASRDQRLGAPFNGRKDIVDPRLYRYLAGALGKRCHVGSYVLSPSTPMFESRRDLIRVVPSNEVSSSAPDSLTVVGMSMAPELDALLQSNDPPENPEGFDRKPRILPFSLVTNIIDRPSLPTKYTVEHQVSGNPATHNEVVDAGHAAEEHLIPAFVDFCGRLQRELANS